VTRRGHLRASDQEREQIVDRLHKAHTEGRIGDDELEQRVSAALKARTYDDLEATVADIPRADRRTPTHRRSAAGWALTTMRTNPVLILVAIPLLAVTAAMVLAATLVFLTICIVFLVVGGRRSIHRGPLVYARHYRWPRHRPYRVPGQRHGPGSDWI
jgi:Domain of unknown function (DUF1707)